MVTQNGLRERTGVVRKAGRGVATGLLALGLLAGVAFAGASADPATVGVERAGTRIGTSSGTRESTVDGAHAGPTAAGIERAGYTIPTTGTYSLVGADDRGREGLAAVGRDIDDPIGTNAPL